jgi:hypothetical protein
MTCPESPKTSPAYKYVDAQRWHGLFTVHNSMSTCAVPGQYSIMKEMGLRVTPLLQDAVGAISHSADTLSTPSPVLPDAPHQYRSVPSRRR